MRASTAFNRVLGLEGTQVLSADVSGPDVVVLIRARSRRHWCSCGWSTTARYDRSRRRWRHLDLAKKMVWLEADIARIDCHACERVVTEDVPWARPGARITREFEDELAWLSQVMDKTAIAQLMRCAWRTVDNTVKRVVAEYVKAETDPDFPDIPDRLEGLRRIGVDEISYKRGHKYLTVVADHDTGRVVWVTEGRTKAAFEEFTTALGPERCAKITAITMDMSPTYIAAASGTLRNARICFDAFHIIKWANEALDSVFGAIRTGVYQRVAEKGLPVRTHWRTARFLLRSACENLNPSQRKLLTRMNAEDKDLARAWELKEGLRDLYRHVKKLAPYQIHAYLHQWIHAAANSGIKAFINLAQRISNHFAGIVAAIELGLSNSRLEGINSRIRVIQRRGFGHHPDSLIAMIYLCMGGIPVYLPHER